MVQNINNILKNAAYFFRKHPRRYIVLGGFLFAVTIVATVFWPRQITFSYGAKTCFYQPTIAPGLLRSRSDSFRLEAAQKVIMGEITLAAAQMCVVPLRAPGNGVKTAGLSLAGLPFLQKKYTVVSKDPPTVSMVDLVKKPLPTSRALVVPMSTTDAIFSYKMTFSGGATTDCTVAKEAKISCDIRSLHLKQGVNYELSLDRYFNGKKVATIARQGITTLTATSVTGSTLSNEQIVYAKPKSLELVTDKEVSDAEVLLVRVKGDQRQEIPTKVSLNGKKISIAWDDDLARQERYEVIATKIIGSDGSGLDGAYKIQFETSGGPKVNSISVGGYKVPTGASAIITFDQPLNEAQDIVAAMSATGGAIVTGKKGTQAFVSFSKVPRCGDVTITVSDALKSDHDVTGGSAWRFDTRTMCQTQTTIGSSVKGRGITAYSFGGGAETILYTGAIHGSEVSTRSLMHRWIDELEMKPRSIPSGMTVVVIPVLNPDGVASGSRTNARNVDLNRNFATNDWRKDITTVTNTPFPGGGGSTPLSEPESQALASFVGRIKPRLVLSYHSIGGLVAANQSGDSSSRASAYARLSGYRNTTGSSDTFEYGISGTADDYYGQVLGVPSVLVELGSHTYHQFELNRNAMWDMLK